MKVLYKWCKKHPPTISPPVDYRYITYDDEDEYNYGDKNYEIKNIALEVRPKGKEWVLYESYDSYTQVLNILHLIEKANEVERNSKRNSKGNKKHKSRHKRSSRKIRSANP